MREIARLRRILTRYNALHEVVSTYAVIGVAPSWAQLSSVDRSEPSLRGRRTGDYVVEAMGLLDSADPPSNFTQLAEAMGINGGCKSPDTEAEPRLRR